MSAANWVRVLQRHSDLREVCEQQFSRWEGLCVEDFLGLTTLAPGLAERCDWTRQWTADEQVEILVERPELAQHVLFEAFSSEHWVKVLSKLPAFANRCDWHIFSERELVSIIQQQEKLLRFVPHGRIVSRRAWINLSKQYESCKERFIEELDIVALDGRAITDILLELPELAERLPMDRITDEIDKKRLMVIQRELAEKLCGGIALADGCPEVVQWKARDGIVLVMYENGDSPQVCLGPCDAIIIMRPRVRCRRILKSITTLRQQWQEQNPNATLIEVKVPGSDGEELKMGSDTKRSLSGALEELSGSNPRSVAIIGSGLYRVKCWFENNSSTISVVYIVDKDDANASR